MDHQQIQSLVRRYTEGKCTLQEKELIENYFVQLKKEQGDFDLQEGELLADLDSVWMSVQKHLRPDIKPIQKWRWAVAAAVVIFFVGFGTYFYLSDRTGDLSNQDLKVIVQQADTVHKDNYSVAASKVDIHPATSRAELILSTGERIVLSDQTVGLVRFDHSAQIDLQKKGELAYNSTMDDLSMQDESPKNTLIVPLGGTYNVTLADGTKVMLNAGSKLTFPISFHGPIREVYLEGEAYFDVSKQEVQTNQGKIRQEFVVRTSDEQIRVLGTRFNVKAYRQENRNKMTLEEGSIELSVLQQKDRKVILKPGQQAISDQGLLVIQEVSVAHELAWIKGDFVFNGDDIQDIMNQIGRWYDMDIVYLGQIPEGRYISTISRSKTLKQVLEVLETTTALRFSIQKKGQERRIMVIP